MEKNELVEKIKEEKFDYEEIKRRNEEARDDEWGYSVGYNQAMDRVLELIEDSLPCE